MAVCINYKFYQSKTSRLYEIRKLLILFQIRRRIYDTLREKNPLTCMHGFVNLRLFFSVVFTQKNKK